MKSTKPVKFTFTELLYGVVIATAITRIDSLVVSQETVLLMAALLFVFDDYIIYHHDVKSIKGGGRNFILLFGADMAVLAAWYALVLATTHSMAVFLVFLACYFVATSIWEFLFSQGTVTARVLRNGDLVLVLAASVLAAVEMSLSLPYWLGLCAFIFVFSMWRFRRWRDLWALE